MSENMCSQSFEASCFGNVGEMQETDGCRKNMCKLASCRFPSDVCWVIIAE